MNGDLYMIDIFTILQNANCINGINITELTDLFVNGNYNVYDIAMVGKGKVVLKNKTENKFEKLDCVCNYFDTNGERLGIPNSLATSSLLFKSTQNAFNIFRAKEFSIFSLKFFE